MTPCASELTQVLLFKKVAESAMALAPECASTPTSRGDKTAIELFAQGVRGMPGTLIVTAEALVSIYQ